MWPTQNEVMDVLDPTQWRCALEVHWQIAQRSGRAPESVHKDTIFPHLRQIETSGNAEACRIVLTAEEAQRWPTLALCEDLVLHWRLTAQGLRAREQIHAYEARTTRKLSPPAESKRYSSERLFLTRTLD